ncbi:hypothetical protein [Parabacteroides goldsteinii]|uniref:hypothetical protein n=1 Tax=Parabacteroides goldsteinii TaxID=328812 RepID=UPI0013EBB6F0|nr:hypothetical protein [Parabacteroides goldsteinii]
MKQVNQLSKLFVQDLNRRMKIPMILVMSVLVLPVAAESKHMLTPPPRVKNRQLCVWNRKRY